MRLLKLILGCSLLSTTGSPVGALSVEGPAGIRPGDRVAIVGSAFADQMRKHGYFETLIRNKYPDHELQFRNLGWAGDTLNERARPQNFPSEFETLRDFGADLIMLCFGMGDSFEGEEGLAGFRSNLHSLCEAYGSELFNGTSPPRLVLVSPTAMEKAGIGQTSYQERIKNLKAYSKAIREVAGERNIRFIDVLSPMLDLIAESEGSPMTTNGVQLSAYGYWVVSPILVHGIVEYREASAWEGHLRIRSNAQTKLEGFKQLGDRYSWRTLASGWSLPPPAGALVHHSLEHRLDRFYLEDLRSGIYLLTSDDKIIARGTVEEWRHGLTLENSTVHTELESLRQAVVDKNAQFFYAWRSLNQVHIVGERKKSPSGRALPGELIRFHALADEKEKVLTRRFASLKAVEWELERELE